MQSAHPIVPRLLLAHAGITAAAGVVLVIAPAAIPSAVGIHVARDAYLLCYLLAAAEFGFAALSYLGARLADVRAVRAIVFACVTLHLTSGLLEMLALLGGADPKLWLNVGARVVIVALFLYFLPVARGGSPLDRPS